MSAESAKQEFLSLLPLLVDFPAAVSAYTPEQKSMRAVIESMALELGVAIPEFGPPRKGVKDWADVVPSQTYVVWIKDPSGKFWKRGKLEFNDAPSMERALTLRVEGKHLILPVGIDAQDVEPLSEDSPPAPTSAPRTPVPPGGDGDALALSKDDFIVSLYGKEIRIHRVVRETFLGAEFQQVAVSRSMFGSRFIQSTEQIPAGGKIPKPVEATDFTSGALWKQRRGQIGRAHV